MKSWIHGVAIFAVISITAPHSQAADTSHCKSISSIARNVMSARQRGEPMSGQIEFLVRGQDKVVDNIMKDLIVGAYEKPRYNAKENQLKAAQNYENSWYLSCVKQAGK